MSEHGDPDTEASPHTDTPADVALRLLAAALTGDVPTAQACCTPDVELLMEDTQVVHGLEEVRHVIEFHTEVATDVRCDIHHVLTSDTGDTVAINRTIRMCIGGTRVVLEVGAFFEFEHGLVRRWVDYHDMRPVTDALGH
ncbi:hypothetical protein NCCP2495_29270 [Dietzia sp. NCCP-2495]|uniref:nuclear transport factor 2 family protein n=1 Tax=Dietzia sp. NCCP-2495 TaxID=2934675 RepID=UPI00222ED1D8|nr:nuclear transport factor 2 family protein [Dietzia sp. NCCP-2495]GLB65047.1 hypothetical protein NCCP2495_29270 [Dietzia sp. NCCP-2495]